MFCRVKDQKTVFLYALAYLDAVSHETESFFGLPLESPSSVDDALQSFQPFVHD